MTISRKKIEVIDYKADWAIQFQELKKVLTKHLGNTFLSMEHVGSTAVPNLKAKPILDIDIIVEDDDQKVNTVIQQLALLGYQHRGDLGIIGRETFKRVSEEVPIVAPRKQWHKHHLYVCRKNCISLLNHLQFRNYLRVHPEAIEAYAALKTKLAVDYSYDMDAYVAGKTNFITTILAEIGLEESAIKSIQVQNALGN